MEKIDRNKIESDIYPPFPSSFLRYTPFLSIKFLHFKIDWFVIIN